MGCKARNYGKAIWRRVTQKKHFDANDDNTLLRRCLSTKRLTFIGVGKTVGVGIYVLIGVATKEYAGPSVIVAFLLAFVVTMLNALCFTEYAAKSAKTGAQYTYMYEHIGEGVAFLVGWICLVGFTAAFSMAARGWSGYLDSLFDHAIQNYTIFHIGNWSRGPPFVNYPDIPAVSICVIVMIVVSIGVNFSAILNTVLAAVSGSLLIFISVMGFIYADINNWNNDKGGFFPYGIAGILKATSVCFYAFQGFEIIGYSAEETKDPQKAIPRAIVGELLIVLALYLTVAISFTLMTPYWTVNIRAPFPGAFAAHSITWAKYIVAIGPILALSNLCLLEMYTTSRLAYSMGTDGLLFRVCSKVNPYTKVPLAPVFFFGSVVIGIVLVLDLQNLIGFMVIFSFVQYSFFAAYTIVLRYENPERGPSANSKSCDSNNHVTPYSDKPLENSGTSDGSDPNATERTVETSSRYALRRCLKNISVNFCVVAIYLASFLLALVLVIGHTPFSGISIFSIAVLGALVVLLTSLIACQQQREDNRGFLVPLMPVLPVLCIFFNMVLLVSAADVGSMSAAAILAGIGAILYIGIVLIDVIRNPDGDARSQALAVSGYVELRTTSMDSSEEELRYAAASPN